jgi:hypothetical protein
MTLEPTIRVGDFITLAAVLIGGLGFVWSMRGDLKMLARDVRAQGKEIEKLSIVITAQAVQTQRIDDLDRRLEELRHWRGFVNPTPKKV